MQASQQVPESFYPDTARKLLAATKPADIDYFLYRFVAWQDTPQGNTNFWDDQAACRTLFPEGRALIEEWLRLSEQ